MAKFEKIYNSMLNKTFKYASPMKRIITSPDCKVHKYINDEALLILEHSDYKHISDFFKEYYQDLNDGTVWADQDFRSSNHLYNPYTKRGLYGRSNAMDISRIYYAEAIKLYSQDPHRSVFYLGATLHIIQDMTVPHHASVRLLNKHKKLESYIRSNYKDMTSNAHKLNPHMLGKIAHYIDHNGKEALKIYEEAESLHIDSLHLKITNSILPLAKRTTAGCMVKFYNDVT